MNTNIHLRNKLRNFIRGYWHYLLLLLATTCFVVVCLGLSSKPPLKPLNTNTALQREKKLLAIIIDDFGQNRNGVKDMMSIDRPLTFAVMPFLGYSTQDAVHAHESGREVIVHLPMQSQAVDKDSWLGPNPIKVDYSDKKIKKIASDSFDSIPYAAGVNIHMGVISSEDERVMSCVMQVAKDKGLYFIDSRTTPNTVCRPVSVQVDIRFAERNFFLESPYKTEDNIKKQLEAAAQYAIKYGHAIAIGHVGSAGGKLTARCIREMIPRLEEEGIEFVYVSQIFDNK